MAFVDGGTAIAGCTAVTLVAGPAGSGRALAACTVTYTGLGYHAVSASYAGSTKLGGSVSSTPGVDVVSP